MKRIRQKQLRLRDQGRRLSDQRRKLEDDAQLRRSGPVWKKGQGGSHQGDEKTTNALQRRLNEIRERHALTEGSRFWKWPTDRLQFPGWRVNPHAVPRIQDRFLLKQSEKRGHLRALLSLDRRNRPRTENRCPPREQLVEKARKCPRHAKSVAATVTHHHHGQWTFATSISIRRRLCGLLRTVSTSTLRYQDDKSVALSRSSRTVSRLEDLRRGHHANIYYSMWLRDWTALRQASDSVYPFCHGGPTRSHRWASAIRRRPIC